MSQPLKQRPLVTALIVAAFGVLVYAAWVSMTGFGERARTQLEVLKEVPEFHLVSSTGASFTRQDLLGSIAVVNFIFTRCTGPCPLTTERMTEIQQMLARSKATGVRLVSVSVDPDHDTPEVLRAYAARHHANPEVWTFLTGNREAVFELSARGFWLPVGETPPEEVPLLGPVTHSSKFVLVDAQGRVRAYYDGSSPEIVQNVLTGIGSLMRESLSSSGPAPSP
jgi:protein SCO1/2